MPRPTAEPDMVVGPVEQGPDLDLIAGEDGDPDHVVEPENALPTVTLDDLPESIREACHRAGWQDLMPVQQHTIPYVLAGRDLMIQSRTGSGKTGAFLLPILDRLDPDLAECQVLILVPTRELCQQVQSQAEVLAPKGVRTVAVYGGTGYGPQLDAFRKGAHMVVGTPGRVLDHLLRGSLRLDHIQFLVFDEADRMLSMGFYPDMRKVKRYLPDRPRDGYMFSATFPYHVMRMAGEFLKSPDMLSLSRDRVHVAEVEHQVYVVPDMKKDRALVRLIELENPTAAIIFCNTKAEVSYVALILQRFGYDADALSSELRQRDRDKVLKRVRSGKLRFLVATDVAARGIDITEISHVIQYEVPEDPEIYVHRAGRTGRAGAGGKAITLAYTMEKVRLSHIRDTYGIDFEEKEPPTDENVEKIVSERLIALLEARLRQLNHLEQERLRRFLPLAKHLAEHEEEISLLAMLLDESYQKSLHAPVLGEEAPPEEPAEDDSGSDEEGDGGRASGGRGGGRKRKRRRRRGEN